MGEPFVALSRSLIRPNEGVSKPRTVQERSDEELMAAVMSGDQSALTLLVGRYHATLLGYLYRLVGGDRPLAEDLVQETLLRVLSSGPIDRIGRSSLGSTRLPPISPRIT